MGYQNSGGDTFVLGLKSEGCCTAAEGGDDTTTHRKHREGSDSKSEQHDGSYNTPHGCVLEWSQIFVHDDRFLRSCSAAGSCRERRANTVRRLVNYPCENGSFIAGRLAIAVGIFFRVCWRLLDIIVRV